MKSNRKRLKSKEDKEDRISDLPDSIIHHILSFLPSTKQAVQTGVLSKRWRNQWTQTPVLIFDSTGMCFENFLNFIETTLTLHDCSKIKKFHLKYGYCCHGQEDPQFAEKIQFATRKYVEDLYLRKSDLQMNYMLPKFLFNNDSLVKLRTERCNFPPNFGEVNWGNLKSLSVSHCHRLWNDQGLECILSGSPLLESLELNNCYGFKSFVIASKSLKNLVMEDIKSGFVDIEISCPKLENLKLLRCLNVRTAKLMNLSSLLCAAIDFYHYPELQTREIMVEEILQQLHHVKELWTGSLFMEILSDMKVKGLFSTVLKIKSLTVRAPDLSKHYSAIVCLLRNSPELENLVIDLTAPFYDKKLNDSWKKFRTLNTTVFGCLESHLKTVMIINFPKRDDKHESFLKLVQFLFKKARVLEKMVFALRNHVNFSLKVHQELLNFPRCSRHAIIEFVKL